MGLIINSSSNFFELAGVLNQENVVDLQRVIRKGLKKYDQLTISIEAVESIDRYGVKAIAELHDEALNNDKRLSIVGYGCKDLYNHFKSTDAAA
ncbi:STAS domain-containing protein [Seonamhaeicola sp. ML3]|uniref:STAS domain-containing protein n=1 Tax=Seonamhaeicola sp. ML3 TaxID=2937786 RepID=UPI00200C2F15|nr:STAS domain-containing protein [Seonamhaeicola sp. ML3]